MGTLKRYKADLMFLRAFTASGKSMQAGTNLAYSVRYRVRYRYFSFHKFLHRFHLPLISSIDRPINRLSHHSCRVGQTSTARLWWDTLLRHLESTCMIQIANVVPLV
jgi:hypothetical protein